MRLTRLALLLSIATSMVSAPAGYGFANNTNSPNSLYQARITINNDTESENESPSKSGLKRFALGLRLQHEDELRQLILDQNDPKSRQFQKYLSVSQFVNRFSPSSKRYFGLVNYLTKNGFKIIRLTPNRLLIEAEGTEDQIDKTLGLIDELRMVDFPDETNQTQNKIPNYLSNSVQPIELEKPSIAFPRHSNLTVIVDGKPEQYIDYSPSDIATAYNYPNSNNKLGSGKTLSGHGVTIAIAAGESYSLKDAQMFWNMFKIKRTGSIKNIYIGGRSHETSGETTMDLEQVGAQAPGANVLMYISKDLSDLNFTLMFNKIITDNAADVISHSYGLSEKVTDPEFINIMHQILEEANAQGISIFNSTGDDGAYILPPSLEMGPQYPSSDPYVISVGGTTLTLNHNGLRNSEEAWKGTGGGISRIFAKPIWQVGPGVPNNIYRNTVDVALDADPKTGYYLVYKNVLRISGGTSFATPNWAAGWVLAIEKIGHRIAMPNIYIYKIGNSKAYSDIFYNVTNGNNGLDIGPGYKAHKGFNHPTGWGAPNFGNLIDWLYNYINPAYKNIRAKP